MAPTTPGMKAIVPTHGIKEKRMAIEPRTSPIIASVFDGLFLLFQDMKNGPKPIQDLDPYYILNYKLFINFYFINNLVEYVLVEVDAFKM